MTFAFLPIPLPFFFLFFLFLCLSSLPTKQESPEQEPPLQASPVRMQVQPGVTVGPQAIIFQPH